MTSDEEALLTDTQLKVQQHFHRTASDLLARQADEIEWEEWVASIRYSSEETWLRCNAFLLGHTLARLLAGRGPSSPAQRDPWVEAFVAVVAAHDTESELVLWVSVPTQNPRADALTRSTAALWLLTEALRDSRPLNEARPGPFPRAVWLAADEDEPRESAFFRS